MNDCLTEEQIREAAQTGRWTDELRDHCASCSPCAETALVTAALCADARELEADDSPLPDPRLIWLRAQIESRRVKSTRATLAIAWVQRAAIICALAVGLVVVPDLWRLLGRGMNALRPAAAGLDMPVFVTAPGLVLVATFAVLALMALWNELVEGSRGDEA
jgi:hypothetical protein